MEQIVATLALPLHAISARRLRGRSQVSDRNTRENLQHGAAFVGKPSALWRREAHNFARWPVSRRDEFPSQERPLQQLENRQPLRRSQAVLNSRALHPVVNNSADVIRGPH
jgi:hypothetical protein